MKTRLFGVAALLAVAIFAFLLVRSLQVIDSNITSFAGVKRSAASIAVRYASEPSVTPYPSFLVHPVVEYVEPADAVQARQGRNCGPPFSYSDDKESVSHYIVGGSYRGSFGIKGGEFHLYGCRLDGY